MRSRRGYRQIFRIGNMTTAEFAFYTIAKDHGLNLTFIGAQRYKTFEFDGMTYVPDFIDESSGDLYEVVGTRQSFHRNRHKYLAFSKAFPSLRLHIVVPDGTPFHFYGTRGHRHPPIDFLSGRPMAGVSA